jgi:hypothetical protein
MVFYSAVVELAVTTVRASAASGGSSGGSPWGKTVLLQGRGELAFVHV